MTTSLVDMLAGNAETAHPPQPTAVVTTGLRVIPYDARNDSQAAFMLAWLWSKMQDDDLVDYYFPGQKDTGYATFVRLFSGGENNEAKVALFAVDHPSRQWDDTIPGFITWTTQKMGASDVIVAGFIFFRKFWDHHTTDECAKAAFNHWFRETPATLVLGVCPSLHAAAMRYNKRVGLHEVGRLPDAHLFKGQKCDAVLMAMKREDWLKGGQD